MAKLLLCLFSLWPNLFMLKRKSLPLPRNLALSTFGELIKVFSAEVNVLLLLYLMVQRCVCYLLEQICLLKPLPRTPILMASVSLYQLSHFYQLLYANKTKVFHILEVCLSHLQVETNCVLSSIKSNYNPNMLSLDWIRQGCLWKPLQ